MPGTKYRALVLGPSGSQVDIRCFEAADDETAMARARTFVPGLGLELWTEERLVVRLAAQTVVTRFI